ncbi:DUF397 domain-containing protein [Nocardiopsis rhodophaea]|uniref:DUF397 domain-containing protein n=1 Tax=Nocardiopsis rhodophaea TaxID=280238 RepID=A0ABN2SXV6_9ACTN
MLTESHLTFRKSSYSQGGREDCVEVADLTGGAALRDSKHPHLGHLAFSASEWRAFLTDVKSHRL